jgi:hypothetical protein
VIRHPKIAAEAAPRSGLLEALALGADVAVSVDADGLPQRKRFACCWSPRRRKRSCSACAIWSAPARRARTRSQRHLELLHLGLHQGGLADTQCGLRRLVRGTLDLDVRADGYAFEAEVVMRAARARWAIAQVPVRVLYPPEAERVSHFDPVRDPARIVARVLATLIVARGPE